MAFQLRSMPGYDWPPLADGALAQVWDACLELERTQWLTRAELESAQLEQFRLLLSHCITEIPYYRDVLPKAGIVPGRVRTMDDFRLIPRLPRRVYQERHSEFEAKCLPPGTMATREQRTSGNSPTVVLQTNLVHLWWCAFFLRDLAWCGVDPAGTLASIRSTGTTGDALKKFMQGQTQSAWVADVERLIVFGPAHVMDIHQDHRLQLQWLRRIKPDYLLSYPSNLETLAGLVQQDGAIPNLKAILAISETLTSEARSLIESAFGAPVRNTYSCAEAGYLASPCPLGHGLHVHAENVILEVLDEVGRPCQPGQTGRVHLTTLQNYRGPFIRYELGDEATVGPSECPCSRGLPTLAAVQVHRDG
jgi:phenylacetate-CoA ligase